VQLRNLGQAGPVSSAIGLGTLALVGGYGAVDADTAVATVGAALDAGVSMLDTADFYGGGEIERLVGKAIRGRRTDALVATRGGARFTGAARPTSFDGSPAYLRRACDDSLRRLGVDHIDLYYLARVDPEVPVTESVGGLAELVAAGKIVHIGLSEVTGEQLRAAHAVHPVSAVQSEYSLWAPAVEAEVLPLTRELGIGFVAHSPLGRGFLTGRIDSADQLAPGDFRRRLERFADAPLRRDRQRWRAAEKLAADRGVTPGQLAIAWLLARGPHVVPIPGTRSAAHLAENVAATRIELSEAEITLLAATLAG
jgi:aryl-alcohol dehydrogenase-like predicted oxidoreductase